MINAVLSTGSRSILPSSLFGTTRAASLNSAIGRGLRRSKGVGFRGRERSHDSNVNGLQNDTASRSGAVRRAAGPNITGARSQMTRDGWHDNNTRDVGGAGFAARLRRGKKEIRDHRDPPPRRSRAARFNDPNSSFGKRSLERRQQMEVTAADPEQFREGGLSMRKSKPDIRISAVVGHRSPNVSSATYGNASGGRRATSGIHREELISIKNKYGNEQEARRGESRRTEVSDADHRAADSDRVAMQRNPDGTKLSASRLAYLARTSRTSGQIRGSQPTGTSRNYRGATEDFDSSRPSIDRSELAHSRSQPQPALSHEDGGTARPRFSQNMEKRLPLSIPYTTSASEFLYGTSVVRAALLSHRNPRRKLYKLYIYAGDNRDNADRDAGIERLARKNRVDVVHVNTDWLRLMDKMSGGRPHNGYILEASPLPRLPVTNLGELTSQNDQNGFAVVVDHQSHEEAAVNGTSNFIPIPRDSHQRKPFVLLLDSIVDPGNLGGIIRTASFLGVTAIAISTRNSASFTPVVLKASAGASENVTLFSVNKPAGFIADSKLAGWKVYAAVAPSGKGQSTHPPSLTTDELDDPLGHDPCVLMLGSEGEGLRWNLRSKADFELSIQGSGQSFGVDSLNVSVATGILCNAFLRTSNKSVSHRQDRVQPNLKPWGDIF